MGNALERRADAVKTQFQDAQMRQGDAMRAAQTAMQIAFARDQLAWGCGLYSLVALGATAATAHAGAFPKVALVPLVVGGFALAYIGDTAYGTKLVRVRHEAEHILANERELLVPPNAMPSRKLWEAEAARLAARPGGPIGRVSDRWYSVAKR